MTKDLVNRLADEFIENTLIGKINDVTSPCGCYSHNREYRQRADDWAAWYMRNDQYCQRVEQADIDSPRYASCEDWINIHLKEYPTDNRMIDDCYKNL